MNIFIDTQDMEERYGEELYKEYLENQNKEMKEKIDKAIDKLYCYGEVFDSKILQQFQREMLEILGDKE